MIKLDYFSNDRFRRIYTPTIAVIFLSLALIPFVGSAEADVPTGFSDSLIVGGLNTPTAMEVAPDGRIFVSELCGDLRVIKNGVLLAEPFMSIPVDCTGERGLLGIAFDPNFVSNGYVYVFYVTQNDPVIHSRVSRVTADPANPDIALAGSEVPILDLEPQGAQSHIGGAIEFGLDDKLYVSVGDNNGPQLAPDLTSRFGKILRINSDGTIPTDNPFYNVPGAYQEIWAYGLRNPFTFQFSLTGTMHIADNGVTSWEEINEGLAGANYGWPSCEGACSTPPFVDPIYTYQHPGCPGCGSIGGASVIAGPFYEGTQFPATYQDSFFFADYVQGFIKRLTPTNQVMDFASSIGSTVDMEEAPDGSLYYLTIVPGQVHKVTYDLANSIPNAVATANPSSGQPPLFVNFGGSLSSDPDGDPLTYSWDFGDGSPPESGVSVQHTYGLAGPYTAILTVDDGNGGTDTDSVLITVGNPPVATINTPVAGTMYNAGTTISFSGSASDIEDGTLPASAYKWTVDFHHNTHFHPFNQYNGIISGNFFIPTVGETEADVWYRIYLKVTDSDGLTHTSFRDILPNTSTITLDTNPTGLQVVLDSQPKTTPYTFEGVVGMSRTLDAPLSQTLNGDTYDYDSWSDGGAAFHTISTPVTDTTYTASYIPESTTFTLIINTVDMLGNPLPGYYTTIYEGGTLIQTGFAPVTFIGTIGTTYTVQTYNYNGVIFHHWEDGSTVKARQITLNSDTTVTAYYIDVIPPVVSASPTSGTFVSSVDVTLSATDNFDPSPTIHYTTDGSTPTTASPVYTAPITITFPTTLNFIAVDSSGNVSPVSTENYVITGSDVTAPVVSASPTSGTFVSSVDVTLSATDNTDPAPTIHYTIDGSPATTASPVYTAPITITFPTTLNFIAADSSGNVSPVSTESYVIIPPTAATLTVISVDLAGDPFPGFYTTIHEGGTLIQTGFAPVTFIGTIGTTYTVETQDYLNWLFGYWEDGSTVAPRQITLNSDTTVTAYYIDTNGDVIPPVVSASPTSGSFFNSVDVTLTAIDAVDPAPTIHYTTDGSTPTTASPVYTAPITITFPTTLNFIAADSSGNVSPVSTESYVITSSTTSKLTVSTKNSSGEEITGYWTVFSQGGTILKTGFSPVTFIVNNGENYKVSMGNYAGVIFDHWEDGSTVNPRTFSITSDTTFTAFYLP